jgi:ankyrin repeat protein
LHIASFKENKEAVEYLIKKGAKANQEELKRGQNALFYTQNI